MISVYYRVYVLQLQPSTDDDATVVIEWCFVQIYLHGKNLSSLHSYVDQAILPAEYGGQQSEFDNTRWRQELIHLEDEFVGNV